MVKFDFDFSCLVKGGDVSDHLAGDGSDRLAKGRDQIPT